MEFKDYYKIIGVERDATQQEIKRAYRKLARKYHPDVSKESNAEMKFKELGEAYEVLKDPDKRIAYDQLGSNYNAGQDFNPPPDWDAGFEFNGGAQSADGSAAFSDFFESLFGQPFRGDYSQQHSGGAAFHSQGEDHHAKILIDLEDAFKGASRSISLQAPEVDPQGHIISRTRTLNVNIPKGVKQGQLIRLSGQGSPAIGNGKAGDLYLEVNFKPHPYFHAEGKDIYLDLPLTPWEAALGATIKIPTPAGSVDLKIPAGSTSGKKMRLKGRGIPANVPGDLYVVLEIKLPPATTPQSKELYKKMQQELNFNPRVGLGV
ncbi:DnaJ-class molecular chaperone CbpA [hydrothermal vent metagenome]|uniref:DnaJ-class molecular chaperone CbpA n=1 Tax=hydrothermal vent metagenome TaxID=652676 RepID=A0A3B0XFH8_9ZZZZ